MKREETITKEINKLFSFANCFIMCYIIYPNKRAQIESSAGSIGNSSKKGKNTHNTFLKAIIMDESTLSVMKLFWTFENIQENIWNAIPDFQDLRELRLKPRQVKAIISIYLQECAEQVPLTLQQLANKLHIQKTSASLLLSSLLEAELICRSTDPDNRRYIRLTVTDRGRAFGDAILNAANQEIHAFMNKFTQEEQQTFLGLAAKINHQTAD